MAKTPKKPSFLNKIAARFGRGPKIPTAKKIGLKPSEPRGGHFGVHATSWEMRRKRVAQGLPAFTQEEQAEWETFGQDTIEDFLFLGLILHVHSSNVVAAQYDLNRQKLHMWFKGRGNPGYEYSNVSRTEALKFATELSKGKFVWDVLRVRGSKTAHQKPYRRL